MRVLYSCSNLVGYTHVVQCSMFAGGGSSREYPEPNQPRRPPPPKEVRVCFVGIN